MHGAATHHPEGAERPPRRPDDPRVAPVLALAAEEVGTLAAAAAAARVDEAWSKEGKIKGKKEGMKEGGPKEGRKEGRN